MEPGIYSKLCSPSFTAPCIYTPLSKQAEGVNWLDYYKNTSVSPEE